ncbi:MAG TPA: GDSL-type esterase/lipase family protein [Streptosporangiaceae bacterium]
MASRAGSAVTALAVLTLAIAGCQAAAGAGPGPAPATSPPSRAASASAHPAPSRLFSFRPQPRGPRIMIVGDSITEGSSGDYTWQYRLYEHLLSDGVRPQMVGPYHRLFNNVTETEGDRSYANPGFEHANDARWGMTLWHEKDLIGAKVSTYQPDYLLVLLGLDDLFWYGISQSGMSANLASFIAAARAERPHIRIVLGLIPPDIHVQTSAAFAESVASFNHAIALTASQLSTAWSPIAFARDEAGFNVAADTWDGTHPNANGEIRIAAAFADVLAGRFHVGGVYPKPFPVLPTGPRLPPLLTVRPSHSASQATLSWTPVPGAGSYYVFVKDVTRRATKFKRLTWPLTPAQDPWTISLLTPGDTYAFRLQACKGTDCGAFSNVASITQPS